MCESWKVLKRVIAHASFKGAAIDLELIKEALRDLFALQDKLVTIDNIQRSVASIIRSKWPTCCQKGVTALSQDPDKSPCHCRKS